MAPMVFKSGEMRRGFASGDRLPEMAPHGMPVKLFPAAASARGEQLQPQNARHDQADAYQPDGRRGLVEQDDAQNGRADRSNPRPDRVGRTERQSPQSEPQQSHARD